MEAFLEDWGLTLVTFIPLAGALVMMAIPKEQESAHKQIALAASLGAVFVAILLLFNFNYDDAGTLQFLVDESWIDVINSRYIVGLDGMSLPLVLLTMLIVPLCIIYSWNNFPEPRNPKAFLILILILETGMIGTFLAQDLVLFFVFFEVVLLPMFFMIAVWGGEDRRYASLKFFLYTLFGSALMLVSFLALFFVAGAETFSMTGLADGIADGGASRTAQLWIFGGMVLGWNFGNGTDVRGTLNYYDHDESETLTTDGIPFLTLTQTRGSSNAGPGVAQARLDRRVISGLRAHLEHCCMLSTWLW